MRIVVLGSAAGGGVPQWNCNCFNCDAARKGRLPSRRVASLAVTGDDRTWTIINAGADVAAQIAATPCLWPTTARLSPIAAIVLTDANIDHTAGLLEFRQAQTLDIYSTALVKTTLCAGPMFSQFNRRFRWSAFEADASPVLVAENLGADLRLWAIPVPGLLPAYAGGARMAGACVAYRFEQAEKTLVYAPVFLHVDATLAAEVAQADAVFLDGTCWTDDELSALGLGTRTSRDMGHAPMSGPDGSLAGVAGSRARYRFFTHVNNSNPILDPASAAATALAQAGFTVCDDGAEIAL